MRVISRKTLREFWTKHAKAEEPLRAWYKLTSAAEWANFQDIKATFGAADAVKVASGKTVIVFDIGGNNYRMIAAVHYNTQVVYVLRILTHPEYDKAKWKDQL
jgi:mRNA interferase HigB